MSPSSPTESCGLVFTSLSVPIVLILTVLGLITNGVQISYYIRHGISHNDCSQYFLLACAILDFSWNMGPSFLTMCYDLSYSYNLMKTDFIPKVPGGKKMISHICCLYVFSSITLFTLMALDRFVAIRHPVSSKMRTKTTILTQLALSTVCVFVIGFLTWFWYQFYFLVYVQAFIIIACYVYIFIQVQATRASRSCSTSSTHQAGRRKEVDFAKVTALNALVSLLICIPCTISIILRNPLRDSVSMEDSCVSLGMMMLLHHPLMSVNYSIHPIMCYFTFTPFRRYVRQLIHLASNSKSIFLSSNAKNATTDNTNMASTSMESGT